MSNCDTCAEKKVPETIPYLFYETEMARAERHTKRLWIAILVIAAMLFLSNAAWLYAWCQYDYESYEVSADGDGVANYIGQDGDIYNGSESFGQATEEEGAG